MVRIALGSLGETLNHLRHAWKRRYISEEEFRAWSALANRALAASTGWLSYLDSCPAEGPARRPRPPRTNAEPRTSNQPRTPHRKPRTPRSRPHV